MISVSATGRNATVTFTADLSNKINLFVHHDVIVALENQVVQILAAIDQIDPEEPNAEYKQEELMSAKTNILNFIELSEGVPF